MLKIELITEEREKDFDLNTETNELKVYLGQKKDLSDYSLRKKLSDLDWKKLCDSELELHADTLTDKQLEIAYEIISLKSYLFDKYKTEYRAKDKAKNIQKFVLKKKDKEFVFDRRSALLDLVKFCRDIVSSNASEINPGEMERLAKAISKECPEISVKVIGYKEAGKLGMGCLLAVGAESYANAPADFHPRMVVLDYQPSKKYSEHLALVGKGITYDTGGLCLKPTNYMLDMKSDMGGSALVLSVFKGIAELGKLGSKKTFKSGVRVTGVLALSENGFGASSYKPGDVLKAMNGKTVQVVDTDAEGRLVLADALSYVSQMETVTQIIDFATLTGSAVAALGEATAAAMTNSPKLFKAVDKAFKSEGENIWQMPIFDEYKTLLDSEIADLAHCSKRPDASVAALFLKEFISRDGEEIDWLHLDIAGMAWWERDGLWAYAGATGFGVKSILTYVESLS